LFDFNALVITAASELHLKLENDQVKCSQCNTQVGKINLTGEIKLFVEHIEGLQSDKFEKSMIDRIRE